jgi:hypothetical protein
MPMITGAHSIIYSKDAAADRAFLRDVLGLPHVDVHDGWLIFALPPAEVAVHPGDENDHHELYLMVGDVQAFMAAATKRGVACAPPQDLRWGILTQVSLPGGGKLGVYEPRHARPSWSKASTASKSKTSRSARSRKRPSTKTKKKVRATR